MEKVEMKRVNLLERLERDESKVGFISIDTARPEVLVEQLGALGCVRSVLTARRLATTGERPTERRGPRRRSLTAAAARRSRRAQRLHREAARGLVGLDAGVDGRLVAERTPS